PTQLKQMSRYLTIAVIVTIPVAVVEAVTGRLLLNELFRMIPGVSVYYPIYGPRRLGVDRVQGPFEHQILYGLFCASALTFAVLLRRRPGSALLTCFASALSMSTGALMAMVLQIGLLSWNWVTKAIKKRWRLLIILIILAYIAVDFLSNRSPIQVFISYATFNAGSGYWRLAIWEYGSQNVIDNPVMGIGMNTWERPNWLHSGSVDNFWLVIAMRTGFPGVLLMMAGFALVLREVARAKPVDPEVQNCQRAWMITVISLFVAAGTVHVWNGMYSFLFFLVGSGLWIVDYARREALQDPEAAAAPEAPVLRGHARWVHGRPGEDDAGAGEAPAAAEPAAPTMHGDPVEALRAARRRRDRTPR
ncbi:MAG: O-antigen ligase family protein, partial [Pseudomonadota bacterium]